MTSNTVDLIRHYEVDGTPGPASFSAARQFPFTDDYRLKIRQLAEIDDQGGTKQKEPDEIAVRLHGHDSERGGLNIHLGRTQGRVAIAINLPQVAGASSLAYAEPLIQETPTNFDGAMPFLKSAEIYPAGGTRWASFVIDLTELRESALARLIIDAAINHHEPYLPVMHIPFSINIWDRALGFSPWMLPNNHHGASLGLSAGGETGSDFLKFFTHNGVHPGPNYYVSVILI